MFRRIVDLGAKVIDRAGYAITLARLSILDRLAGPMPELPTDGVINEETERLRLAFAEFDRDNPVPRPRPFGGAP
jgi:hypothetical protein